MKPLTRDIKAALASKANAEKAEQARAYMKSAMPFHGVAAPEVKKICMQVFPKYPLTSQAAWHEAMLDLWRQADFREERYVAENLAAVKPYRAHQTPKTIPIYQEMIVDGAWWDLVDGIVNRLGELLIDYPGPISSKIVSWSKVKNFWQRRASIICQLKLKQNTNEGLLFDVIETNMVDDEFFIRKGIGWALREYAKTNSKAVIKFVTRNKDSLRPLSKREGLRILLKNGVITSIP